MSALLDKLPAQLQQAATSAQGRMDDKALHRVVGIIDSITPLERVKPELIKASRKRRIPAGAGVPVQEVNRLLAQFVQTQKMMKQFSKRRDGEDDAQHEGPDARHALMPLLFTVAANRSRVP